VPAVTKANGAFVRAVFVGEFARQRHRDHRADPLRGEQQAGFERRGAAHGLVIERDQQQRAEEGDREEHEHTGRGAGAGMGEGADVDQRAARLAPAVEEEARDQRRAGDDRRP
jgi:hypothetical protein